MLKLSVLMPLQSALELVILLKNNSGNVSVYAYFVLRNYDPARLFSHMLTCVIC